MSTTTYDPTVVQVDLTNKAMYANPWQIYAKLRHETPVCRAKSMMSVKGKLYIVTRYDDVVTLYKDPRFSTDLIKQKGPWMRYLMPSGLRLLLDCMVFKDDPEHRRLRQMVDKSFTPKMIETLTKSIEDTVEDLLGKLAAKQGGDLVSEFSLPLPLTVICEMLGVPEQYRSKFHKLANRAIELSTQGGIGQLKALPINHQLVRLFNILVKHRTQHPDDRMITALININDNGDSLRQREITAMIYLLLLAGHETTTSLISTGVLALLDYPDEMQKLRDNPESIDLAVEELLRYTSPVTCGAPRHAMEDVEIAGVTIPKGAEVIGMINSANRDETVFDNPNKLDICRAPNKHIAFGQGNHLCLGLWLARLEGKIAINGLLKHFNTIDLQVLREEIRWKEAENLRGLAELPLNLR